MRKSFVFIFLAVMPLFIASTKTPQEAYIEQYSEMAVVEMYRSGVPASITLAQGLLESQYGLSELATKGNNHFGIKCHRDWTGKTMFYDDDQKGECFRVYASAADSYADHSDFLRYKDRYKFLFDYKTSDYKSWCNGLKKAGYATDPSYASKLIKVIEDYKLYEYDSRKPSRTVRFPSSVSSETEQNTIQTTEAELAQPQTSPSQKSVSSQNPRKSKAAERRARKASKKAKVQHDYEDDADNQAAVDEEIDPENMVIPDSPLKLEQSEKYAPAQGELHFTLSRPVYSKNGVPFVYSMEGDTYAGLAENYDLFKKEILSYNELSSDRKLEPGTVVYIQPKKNKSRKGLDMHIVDGEGETLRDISQRYAVKMKSLLKLNGIDSENYTLSEGDKILLR